MLYRNDRLSKSVLLLLVENICQNEIFVFNDSFFFEVLKKYLFTYLFICFFLIFSLAGRLKTSLKQQATATGRNLQVIKQPNLVSTLLGNHAVATWLLFLFSHSYQQNIPKSVNYLKAQKINLSQ